MMVYQHSSPTLYLSLAILGEECRVHGDETLAAGLKKKDPEAALLGLKPEVDRINTFPVSETIQLELPVGLTRFRALPWLWSRITGR